MKSDFINYYEFSELFDQVYLEDSFVEKVEEEDGKVEFFLELVIRENSPRYKTPLPNEFACFLKGKISFFNVKGLIWFKKDFRESIDALGQKDIGNIDTFIYCSNATYLDFLRTDIDDKPSLSGEFKYLSGDRLYIPKGYYYLSGDWGNVAILSEKPVLEIF